MAEYIINVNNADEEHVKLTGRQAETCFGHPLQEQIVRCKDCKYLDDSEYRRWDSSLAECYGEPPLFCDLLSFNEWRMDGDRRVAETTFAEVEPDGFCKWGEPITANGGESGAVR